MFFLLKKSSLCYACFSFPHKQFEPCHHPEGRYLLHYGIRHPIRLPYHYPVHGSYLYTEKFFEIPPISTNKKTSYNQWSYKMSFHKSYIIFLKTVPVLLLLFLISQNQIYLLSQYNLLILHLHTHLVNNLRNL